MASHRKAELALNGVPTCRDCSVPLSDGNWPAYLKKTRRKNYLCRACKNTRSKARYVEHKPRILAWNKAAKERLKKEVILEYGDCCACCGESDPRFLTVDHVNNDGKQDREQIGGGNSLYAWLRKNGFPKDRFQLLCWNCNLAKFHYGECPHKMMMTVTVSESV